MLRWVRPWIRRREKFGAYHTLMKELAVEDDRGHKNFLRMDQIAFQELASLVSPLIKRKDTNMRQSITPSERLALTLRFLATGTYTSVIIVTRDVCKTLIPLHQLIQIGLTLTLTLIY